jgi:hypothetical protein
MRRSRFFFPIVFPVGLLWLWGGACASPSKVPMVTAEPELRVTCDAPPLPDLGPIDAVIALDVSRSVDDPSGYDINQNGEVARIKHSEMTDVGDSILSAEVIGLRAFLELTKSLSDARFALVRFTGSNSRPESPPPRRIVWMHASEIEVPLTDDVLTVNVGLQRAFARGGGGMTNFSAGMFKAIEALDLEPSPYDPPRTARKVVFFLSNSSDTILVAGDGDVERIDFRMFEAASMAIERGIVFNTFGLGHAAENGGNHTLSLIAGATGGVHRSVPDPRTLACDLAKALAQPQRQSRPTF